MPRPRLVPGDPLRIRERNRVGLAPQRGEHGAAGVDDLRSVARGQHARRGQRLVDERREIDVAQQPVAVKPGRRSEPAHERSRQHRVPRVDHDVRVERVEQRVAQFVAAAHALERADEPAEARAATCGTGAVDERERFAFRRGQLEFHRRQCRGGDRVHGDASFAEGVDVRVRREAPDEPARDVPAEADRDVGPGDAAVRKPGARPGRPALGDAARGGCDALQLRLRRFAQRTRLRIREQAQQAIMIGGEGSRVGNGAGRARRERVGLACRVFGPEAQRACAQAIDGVDVEGTRRHGTRAARRVARRHEPKPGRPGPASGPSGSPWSAPRRAERPRTGAGAPAGTASSVRCDPWDWDNCRRPCPSPSLPPCCRRSIPPRPMLPVSARIRMRDNRPRRPRCRLIQVPAASARTIGVVTAAAAVESTRLAATGPSSVRNSRAIR